MTLLLQYTLIFASVLILVALGGCFAEHSGVINLGLEGIMIMGALGGALTMRYLPSDASAIVIILSVILVAAAVGMLYSCLLAVACINFKADQTLVGTALNLLGTAGATVIVKAINTAANPDDVSSIIQYAAPKKAFTVNLGSFEFSWFMLVTALLLTASYVLLYKTRFGLRLRMVGENPKAAATMGLRVHGIKYCGVLICGALAGVGGAYLSLDQLDMFVRNMTAGRGYIAVAIAILGRYNPAQIVPCALLFGFCDAVQIYLQGEAFPPQIVQMLPYIVTLLVLAFGVKHIKPPAGVGKYDDE